MTSPLAEAESSEPAPVPSQVVICGKGSIATSALSFTVHYVATQRLSTRIASAPNIDDTGQDSWQPSLIRCAAALGVPCIELAGVESVPDLLLISLEYDRIVRVKRFVSRRLYNIHFSLLPRYRGVLTSVWPILNRETSVGVTLHYMDAGIDTGSIVAQVASPLPRSATSRELYDLYLREGLALFQEWLPCLFTRVPAGSLQNAGAATSYDRRSLDMRRLEVDLSADAVTVSAFVRALSFPEYQHPTVRGRSIRRCAILPGGSGASPGTPLHETAFSTSFAVGGGGIVEMQWA